MMSPFLVYRLFARAHPKGKQVNFLPKTDEHARAGTTEMPHRAYSVAHTSRNFGVENCTP